MGTDIHCVFQAEQNGRWVDVETKYDENRQYALFAWLGDVCNGVGFAGCKTHTPIEPLSSQRGVPEDFEWDGESHPVATKALLGWRVEYCRDGEPLEIWMGDHSHSWLNLDEILNATPPTVYRTGVVSLETFKAWDGVSAPESWWGFTFGRDIVTSTPDTIDETTTHVQIEWPSDLSEEFKPFLDECRRLKQLHGNVRIVFGFDS